MKTENEINDIKEIIRLIQQLDEKQQLELLFMLWGAKKANDMSIKEKVSA